MHIDDIFESIQGESLTSGKPTVFIRTFGCNVACSYCDQPQKHENVKLMTVPEVVNEVRKYGLNNVCLTGGEPTLQLDWIELVHVLAEEGYSVTIETNGCVELPSEHVEGVYVMDVKCPSSGTWYQNILDNLGKLDPYDQVKFVISDRTDYDFMTGILNSIKNHYKTRPIILVSPCFSADHPIISEELVRWILADKLDVVVQIQLHKILNVL